MLICRYMWIIILPLIITSACWGWRDPALGSRAHKGTGGGYYTSKYNQPQNYGRAFRETDLNSTNGHGPRFGTPAQSGHAPSDLSSNGSRYTGQIDAPMNSEQESYETSGQEEIKPLLEQGNPFYNGRESSQAIRSLFNWVFKAPEGVFNRVYNIVDEKVFPDAPATSGSQERASYQDTEPHVAISEQKVQGFSGGGISPFMQSDRSLNHR